MKRDSGLTDEQLAGLNGAVAELVHDDVVEGFVAIQTVSFRSILLAKQVGCWLLFTWLDGSIEIDEDYPPFMLVTELLSGEFRDEDRDRDFEVRWAIDDHQQVLWQRYGIHEPPGYYMAVAAERRHRP